MNYVNRVFSPQSDLIRVADMLRGGNKIPPITIHISGPPIEQSYISSGFLWVELISTLHARGTLLALVMNASI